MNYRDHFISLVMKMRNSHSSLHGPSLDETVEVGCTALFSQSQPEAFQPLPETVPRRSKLQETTNASCSEMVES